MSPPMFLVDGGLVPTVVALPDPPCRPRARSARGELLTLAGVAVLTVLLAAWSR